MSLNLKKELKSIKDEFVVEFKKELKEIFYNAVGKEMPKETELDYYINATDTEKILKSVFLVKKIYVEIGGTKLFPTIVENREGKRVDKLVILIPKGLSYKEFYTTQHAFETALDGEIKIEHKGKRVYMSIYKKQLEIRIPFSQEIIDELKEKQLSFPIGYTREGKLIVFDLTNPVTAHLLIGGYTGTGKSSFIRQVIYALSKVYNSKYLNIYFADLKDGGKEAKVASGLDHVKDIAITKQQTKLMITDICDMIEDRGNKLAGLKIDTLHEAKRKGFLLNIPFVVFVIDEFHRLKNDSDSMEGIELLLATARSIGIHLILGTQRPDAQIVPGIIKANLSSVMCFRTKDGVNSRIILDNENASNLPSIPGRGIFATDKEVIVQVPFIDNNVFPRSVDKQKNIEDFGDDI